MAASVVVTHKITNRSSIGSNAKKRPDGIFLSSHDEGIARLQALEDMAISACLKETRHIMCILSTFALGRTPGNAVRSVYDYLRIGDDVKV